MGINVSIDYNFLVYIESVLFSNDDYIPKCRIAISRQEFFMGLKFPLGFRKIKLRVRVKLPGYTTQIERT